MLLTEADDAPLKAIGECTRGTTSLQLPSQLTLLPPLQLLFMAVR